MSPGPRLGVMALGLLVAQLARADEPPSATPAPAAATDDDDERAADRRAMLANLRAEGRLSPTKDYPEGVFVFSVAAALQSFLDVPLTGATTALGVYLQWPWCAMHFRFDISFLSTPERRFVGDFHLGAIVLLLADRWHIGVGPRIGGLEVRERTQGDDQDVSVGLLATVGIAVFRRPRISMWIVLEGAFDRELFSGVQLWSAAFGPELRLK